MPYKEYTDEDLKTYYTIGEVANMVNQATSALRFWESEFPWLRPKKNKNGDRQYSKKDVQDVLDINILLNAFGMTLKGVKTAHEYGYIEEIKDLYKEKVRQE